MGTPCVIAMRNSEDSYRWIFSPYNGDIQSVGRMLFDHYDTKEKVERLLDDGDIDLLAPNVEECKSLSEPSPYYSGGQGPKTNSRCSVNCTRTSGGTDTGGVANLCCGRL